MRVNEELIFCEDCGKIIEPRSTNFQEMCSECESKFKEEIRKNPNRNLFVTLKEFVVEGVGKSTCEIDHPKFHKLYMRRSLYPIDGISVNAIVVASVEVYEEGKGDFNALLKDIIEMTDKPIMIENVHNEHLAEALTRKGFIEGIPWERCYWLWRE